MRQPPARRRQRIRPSRRAAPNILFLFADDWAWPHASCRGDPAVKTPTFDRIAKEGVLFRNAHTAAPSCSPTRAAILTGQWHWRLEQGVNLRGFIPAKFTVYPDLLEKAGYFVGLTVKGYGPDSNEGRPHYAAGPAFKDFEAFLAARPKDRPFCFWFGSGEPHRPYEKGSGLAAGMKPEDIVVPPYLPDTPEIRSDILDYYVEVHRFDRDVGEVLRALQEAGKFENTLVIKALLTKHRARSAFKGYNGYPRCCAPR